MMYAIVLSALVSLLGIQPALAQATLGNAAVAGTVLDEHGLPVADATITLTDSRKSMARKSFSDSTGAFLFPSISAGTYTIQVGKVGFSSYFVSNLEVEVGQRAFVNVPLQVGEIRTVVTVSAIDGARLDTESNVVGTVIDSERVADLPLNGRYFAQLGLLSGGALEPNSANNFFSPNVGPPERVVVLPGTLPYSVGYYLDGVPIRGSRDGELALNVSIAAIDQFKVEKSFLPPDQGPNAAVVNVVRKSGGNQFHGEVFEFFRNGALDARSFFSLSAEDLKQNQFGFAFGGPIKKDRIWFHSFYEGLRQITGFSAAGYSPTAAMFAGNVRETALPVYDPATYSTVLGQRQPFPGDQIPPNRINPVSAKLLKYYLPGLSLASQPSNIYGNPRNTMTDNQWGIRVDTAISTRQLLFVEMFLQSSPAVLPSLYPLSGLSYANQADVATGQHTVTVSPHVVNTLRGSFLRAIALGENQARDEGPSTSSLGIMNAFGQNGITGININGFSSFGRSNGDVGNHDNSWRLDEALDYIRGSHSFKVGAGIAYRIGWHANANSNALGTLNFLSTFTAQLTPNASAQLVPQANTGSAWADFLLGLPTNGTLGGLPEVQYRATQFLPFIEDTWKITRNLVLNYGLSWYLETPPNPQGWARNSVHGFDPQAGLLTYAALGQIDPKGFATDWNNIAPRVGIAWHPSVLKNTVVRGAFGTYFSELPWVASQFDLLLGSPIGTGQGFSTLPSNPIPQYELGKNVFPPLAAAPLDSSYALTRPPGTLASQIAPSLGTGYVNQWNFSLQQELTPRDFLEFSYLGSSGHRLLTLADMDQCRPVSSLYCDPATKPWPRYGALLTMDSSGNSSYEGLITKYQRHSNRGLNLLFEYTFAKALTDAWQSTLTPSTQITVCRICDKGPATFNVRQRVVASIVWEVPFGRSDRYSSSISRAARAAVGGWTVTGIVTLSTGQPVYLTAPNTTGSLYISPLPNRICNGNDSAFSGHVHSNGLLWFNPSCFVMPPVGFFGDSGRTVVNGPGLNNWDVGLEKVVPLTSHDFRRVVFRMEMFNGWNHAQFQAPDANVGDGSNFGRISATRPPRLLQLGIKLLF
jgi:hypothetical protein